MKKIIILLEGGLGNQMFQVAFGSIIAKKNNSILTIDRSNFVNNLNRKDYSFRVFGLDVFKIKYNNYNKKSPFNILFNKFCENKTYTEPSFNFDSEALKLRKPICIKGYFQSYKYFEGYEDLVRNIFKFPKDKIGKKNNELLNDIKKSNSVSIHIRRGDYVNNNKTNKVHGTCSLEYYINAIKNITDNNNDRFTLFFFSDDIDWVKEKFINIDYNKTFVSNNTNDKSWIDMFLMSSCNHNVIANSSFSFWGAWLNSNLNKKVIAPKRWFLDVELENQAKNIIPPQWIKI